MNFRFQLLRHCIWLFGYGVVNQLEVKELPIRNTVLNGDCEHEHIACDVELRGVLNCDFIAQDLEFFSPY